MEAKWKRRRRNGRRKQRAIPELWCRRIFVGRNREVQGSGAKVHEGVGGKGMILGSECVCFASKSIARWFPAIIVWASVTWERGNKDRPDENMMKKHKKVYKANDPCRSVSLPTPNWQGVHFLSYSILKHLESLITLDITKTVIWDKGS